ncbi:MAG: hypothetical protein R3F44_01265 [Candidatus Competibacteraceae bacterium]
MQYDPDTVERPGPLTVGVGSARPGPSVAGAADTQAAASQQRVVVIGDGDFLSNTYLGNGGNLQLGLNIMNWLALDDTLIVLRPSVAPDIHLDLSDGALALIAAIFLLVLPTTLLVSGWLIRFRRRRR